MLSWLRGTQRLALPLDVGFALKSLVGRGSGAVVMPAGDVESDAMEVNPNVVVVQLKKPKTERQQAWM